MYLLFPHTCTDKRTLGENMGQKKPLFWQVLRRDIACKFLFTFQSWEYMEQAKHVSFVLLVYRKYFYFKYVTRIFASLELMLC